jgi:hypothetical protein
MTIWILAVLLMASVSLAAWRQGAIRATFAFFAILIAALLAGPIGKLIHPLLPHLGVANPILAWALSPVIGFIIASIPLRVASHFIHVRVEQYYKYQAGDLRLALWERMNSRLGICLGILNGSLYFLLISFYLYNLTYWTTQVVPPASRSEVLPLPIRFVNSLGEGLQSSGFARSASGVATLPPNFYKLADLTGLLSQNPQLGARVGDYPGFTSLWHRGDMRSLIADPTITNSLAAGTSLNQIVSNPTIEAVLIPNKELTKLLLNTVLSNYDDFIGYLNTGKSVKFGNEPIIGDWTFNVGVTLAWLRQEQPKMGAAEMRAMRALWSEAYASTAVEATGDNQVFLTGLPKFNAAAQQGSDLFKGEDWSGDWSHDGANYTIHLTLNGQDKFLTGTTDGIRLRVKDGHNLLIFDHVE